MAEQLNKLGQVLVYNSDVKLIDKTPGGKGFQSITLNDAGAYVDGAIVGDKLHFVKSTGTAAENGQALVDAYAAAAAKTSVTENLNLPVVGANITGFQQYGPGPGDPTIPFTGWNYGNDGGFSIPTPTWDPSELLDGQYLRVILIDVNGNECDVLLDIGTKFPSSFRTSIDRIYSGTPFPMEDLASIKFDKTFAVKQHVVAAPGRYLLPSLFFLNAYVDISSTDGGRSIILEKGSPAILYSYTGVTNGFDYVKISGIDGYSNEVQISLASNAKPVIFENCSGWDYSFIHAGGTYIAHTFINCKSNSNSFGYGGGSLTNCKFYNCESFGNSFGYNLNSLNNGRFYNCVARASKSFIYNTPNTSGTWVIGCTAESGRAFVAYDTLTNTNHNDLVIKNCYEGAGIGFGYRANFGTGRQIFEGCLSRNGNSFGYESTGGHHNNLRFVGCTALNTRGFGRTGDDLRATMVNCTGVGSTMFQNGTNVTTRLFNCTSANGNFNSVQSGISARIAQCIDQNGNFRNFS